SACCLAPLNQLLALVTMKCASDRGPVRLGDLIRDGKLLWLYCRECYRERDVDPATIPLPPDLPVPEIGKNSVHSADLASSTVARSCTPAGLKRSEVAAESRLLARRTCRRTANRRVTASVAALMESDKVAAARGPRQTANCVEQHRKF